MSSFVFGSAADGFFRAASSASVEAPGVFGNRSALDFHKPLLPELAKPDPKRLVLLEIGKRACPAG